MSWLGLVLVLQRVSLPWLLAAVPLFLLLAVALAPVRCHNLLHRSRWLILSLGTLFFFLTPGEYLPGIAGQIGLTYEGLLLGGEQLSRLLVTLASLSLLHERVGNHGLMSGLYWMLRRFRSCNATVVRLMLAIEFVEQQRDIPVRHWRHWLDPEPEFNVEKQEWLTLVVPDMRMRDWFLTTGVTVLVVAVWMAS